MTTTLTPAMYAAGAPARGQRPYGGLNMQSPLNLERLERLWGYMSARQLDGLPATVKEAAEVLDTRSTGNAYRYIQRLADLGYVALPGTNRTRAIRVLIPLMQRCGELSGVGQGVREGGVGP